MFKHLQKRYALVALGCCLFGSNSVWAQSNPQPQSLPYTQDFSELPHAASAYPDGWQGWLLSTSPGSNFRTTAPTGDRTMLGNSTSTTTNGAVHNYNGKIGFLNSGSVDLSVAFAINTLQKSTVSVSFDMMTLRNPYDGGSNTRINEAVLQYRIGTSGAFINIVGTEYRNNEEKFATSGNTEPQKVERFTITLPEEANNQEVVQLRWASRQISGGGSRPSFAVDNVEVKSLSDSKQPSVLVPASLAFGDVVLNQPNVTSYTLTTANLTGTLQLASTGGFTISKEAAAGYATSLSFTAAELSAKPTVYVRVVPATAGEFTGSITHTASGLAPVVTEVTATGVSPFAQNFNNCGTSLPGGWKAYSVAGDQNWACTTFGRETEESPRNSALQINGFSGSARDNQDWLISPALDLTDFNIAALSFWTRTAFKGPGMKLMVSTNYDGSSAPATAAWTELNANFPATASDVWKQSVVDLTAYKGAAVYVAFVYTSEAVTDGAARWTVDDFAVENVDQLLVTSDINFDFGVVEVPNASAPQTFTFKGAGFAAPFTLTAGSGFELSKDGQAFASSLTYTVAEATTENTVAIRFKPASTALKIAGNITFTSGDFSVTKGSLIGSSLPKSSTLDIVTWNMEWFGADKDDRGAELGPEDEELQFQNAKKLLQDLNADIFAFQEVSNDEAIARLVSELNGYDFVKSDVTSYSWDPSRNLVPQKLVIAYKKDVVQVKSQKVLLQKLYTDVIAGTATLPNYPSSQTSFWASGRLPFMVEVEATMNGVTQRLHLVNLHTRANSGTNVAPYNQRKYDIQVLKDSLVAQYPDINLVMMGDMNDDVDVSVVNNLPSTLAPFVADNNYRALTYDLSTAGQYSYASGSFRSFLDHIIISKAFNDEYVEESTQIENGVVNSIPSFRGTTSDHAPVSARFTFTGTPAVTFSEAYVAKAEDAGTFAVNLTLSESQAKPHTVYFTVEENATATAADYRTTPPAANNVFAVTIPANATTTSFDVTLADDKLVEPTEQVTFTITGVSTDLGVGASRNFTLAIRENDIPVGVANGQELAFRVYPNPTHGNNPNLMLPQHISALDTITLTVFKAEGNKLFEITGDQQSVQEQLSARTATLRNGMYILKLVSGSEVYQTRMVKN